MDALPRTLKPQAVRRLIWFGAVGMYLFVCLVMDLLPRHGPPDFRYTGSDPAFAVWNIGWPLAQFIYDSRTGLHTGPTAVPLMVLQTVVLAVGMFVGWLRHRRAIRRGIHWLT